MFDNKSKEPISFVNIGILGENFGTVSDEEGRFNLELKDKFNNDILRLSCIEYEDLNIIISDFKGILITSKLKHLELKPKIYIF